MALGAVLALATLSASVAGQAATATGVTSEEVERGPPIATFSILGYDPETGEVGGAVQSRVFAVGNGVLWAEANVGVVVTQAIVDVSYAPQSIELLRQGLSPAEVVETVLANDPDPRPDNWSKLGRQFSVNGMPPAMWPRTQGRVPQSGRGIGLVGTSPLKATSSRAKMS
ncbi:MAG: DUF1028 domain-containing protein [Longimicrobiales bacterium]|nr:DUF1028 domain-containing protein [Longimicrobiales bacterium]